MDTGIHYPLTELNDVYKDISGNVEKCSDVSNYDEKRKISLLVWKNKKVIGLMNNQR